MGMIINPFFVAPAGGTDPSFSSVVLLCHFDGANLSTTYTDSSLTASDPTNSFGTTLTTTSPLYGTACLNVVNGRATRTSIAANAIGTADFTVELAIKTASPTQVKTIYDHNDYGNNGAVAFGLYISTSFRMYVNGSDRIVGGTVSTSTWQRVALSRVSGVSRLYIDGTQVGSNYTDGNSYAQGFIDIGGDRGNASASTATYDEVRFTNGVGRYSSNYTVDAAAFPNS